MHSIVLCSFLAASASAFAQTLTVPAAAFGRDGTGVLDGAGFERAGRLQIVLGESHLASAVGASFRALRLRRDGSPFDLRSGAALVTLTASASSQIDAERPSPTFALNHGGTPTTLFAGTLPLPAAPRLQDRNAARWLAPDCVTIPFSAPFPYAGGTLCLQLDIVPVSGNASSWWPVDAERDGTPGIAVTRGQACGAVIADRPASVDVRALRVGSTVRFSTLGTPGSIAVLVLGSATVGPIDLAFLGAPGCKLHVLPEVTATASTSAAIVPGRPGAASLAVMLPNESRLAGAELHTQWLIVDGSRLTTTNALDITVSAAVPALHASTVAAASASPSLPTVGRVDASLVPVVQLDYAR